MDKDRALIATGIAGALIAALCCATPLLVGLFGALGLAAWIANAGYVLIPALLICLALVMFRVGPRRRIQP
jgi:mercuric ion transport protein